MIKHMFNHEPLWFYYDGDGRGVMVIINVYDNSNLVNHGENMGQEWCTIILIAHLALIFDPND